MWDLVDESCTFLKKVDWILNWTAADFGAVCHPAESYHLHQVKLSFYPSGQNWFCVNITLLLLLQVFCMLLKVLMLHVTHNGRVWGCSQSQQDYILGSKFKKIKKKTKKTKNLLTQTAALDRILLNAGLWHTCERGLGPHTCYQAALRLLCLSAPHWFINQFVYWICAFNTHSLGDSCSCRRKLYHRALALLRLLLLPLFISKIYWLLLS